MNAESVLAALHSMAGQTEAKTKTKEQKIKEAAASAAATVDPKHKVVLPAPVAVDPPADDEEQPENELAGLVPVVVLDDGETFSDLAGARIAMVKAGSSELTDGAYASGIPISGLLELYNAIRSVVR